MKKQCNKCEGLGKIHDEVEGIATSIVYFMFQSITGIGKKICPKCNGKGKIKTQ